MAGTPPAGVVGVARLRLAAAPSLLRWTLACALAEGAGMTAAVAAARHPQTSLLLVVAAGLVEGSALGAAQATLLGRWLPALNRLRYVLATVLVAGLGWAAASAPATLASGDRGSSPPVLLVLLGAAGLGLLMGTLLGAAQAATLRGAVPHPWRWVAANAAAWPPAMVLVFVGATSAGADWALGWLLLLGLGTGAAAGTVLGIVTHWHLASLDGPPPHNLAVLALLGSSWRGPLARRLLGLELHGRRTGRTYQLPVRYATDHNGLVVVPGRPERKSWWTNLRRPGTHVEVLWEGAWHPGRAYLLRPGDNGYELARATYQERWPRPPLPDDQLVVRLRDATRGNH